MPPGPSQPCHGPRRHDPMQQSAAASLYAKSPASTAEYCAVQRIASAHRRKSGGLPSTRPACGLHVGTFGGGPRTLVPSTSRRQLLGINLHHDAGTQASMSDHGRMQMPRPEVDGRPASGADVAQPHLPPRITSFRTRRSALSGGQQAAWERLWPEMGMHARDADGPAPRLDTESWFGRSAPVVLEIGCGGGTSTLAMAKAEPDLDVVAVEVYRRGL